MQEKRMVREKASDGQYVRGDVYFGLNLLLGEIAEEIIDRPYDGNRSGLR